MTDQGANGKLRGALNLVGLVLAVVVVFQLAFTCTALNGHDFDDARRVGQATVESCDRRGPIGLRLGYWDDCVVTVKWNDGVSQHGKLGKPHLFHAGEVGRTVEIGDNGTGRNGRTYSRPTFEPQPVLAAIGIVLFVIAAVPGLILLWLFWHLVRDLVGRAFRRR